MQLLLDPDTHDLAITPHGHLVLTEDTEKTLAQRIKCRLSQFRGEWFLGRQEGVPYFEEVLKKHPDLGRIRALLLTVVADTDGVKDVLEFTTKLDARSREFLVIFRVLAIDGTIVEGTV